MSYILLHLVLPPPAHRPLCPKSAVTASRAVLLPLEAMVLSAWGRQAAKCYAAGLASLLSKRRGLRWWYTLRACLYGIHLLGIQRDLSLSLWRYPSGEQNKARARALSGWRRRARGQAGSDHNNIGTVSGSLAAFASSRHHGGRALPTRPRVWQMLCTVQRVHSCAACVYAQLCTICGVSRPVPSIPSD